MNNNQYPEWFNSRNRNSFMNYSNPYGQPNMENEGSSYPAWMRQPYQNYPAWMSQPDLSYLSFQTNPAIQATLGATKGLGSMSPTSMANIGGDIANIFGSNPYETLASGMGDISPILKDYLNKSTAYLAPYQQAGVQSLGDYMRMLKEGENPQQLIGNIEGGYTQSPGEKYQEQKGLSDISTGAAAQGLLGSGAQARSMMKYGTNLANLNMNDYLKNVLGVRGETMSGLSGLTGQGQQAGTTMGGWTYGTGQNLANLQSQIAQANALADEQDMSSWGNLAGDVASLFI